MIPEHHDRFELIDPSSSGRMLVALHRSRFPDLPMKSLWLVVFVVAAIASLRMPQANSDEPDRVPASASDTMNGKEPGQVRDDNDLKMKLVWCPPGEFKMGSPKSEAGRLGNDDQVEVTLTKGFWLGKYEVTQSEWKQVMETEPWKGERYIKEGADYPATFVSWNDVTDFCHKLTDQERKAGRLSDGWEYTLPTEAQWECACRARTETRFSHGDDESKLGDCAWFSDNTSKPGQYAHSVGEKKPNPWGLCDMHGNVAEWCRDVYTNRLPGGRDPEVKSEQKTRASVRVFRGGCWRTDSAHCRSGSRSAYIPDLRFDTNGFRVALCAVR